ncbi:MAG: zinc-dependent metalloprotease, partial [Oligoflexia bacterium]|nr:zinc-dependent metalloprotease [Oligoflexia bacterium]
IERTSLKIFREDKKGEMEMRDYHAKSYKRQKGDYYAVPFIGYPIQYCKPEAKVVNDVEYLENRLNCEDSHLRSGDYIRVTKKPKKYDYKVELKKDLFPSEYFEGLWYFSEGSIEAPNPNGQVYYKDEDDRFKNMHLIALRKEGDRFNLIDMSGDVQEKTRNSLPNPLLVKRHSFEMAQNGNGLWESLGERKKERGDKIKRPYAQIDFESLTITDKETFSGTAVKGELIELIIEPDYLSYVHKITHNGNTFKWKTSYARAQDADKDCLKNTGFDENCLKAKIMTRERINPRRWFREDHEKVFGIMPTIPQDEIKRAETTETERGSHIKMIRFNTRLNTEEEKRTRTKTIKWYFSKNSTKDPDYREVAEKAVRIYDQAFEHLSQGRDRRIKIELVKEEEKDLGDLRYNIINLVQSESIGDGGLLGVAPSYANPDTGQIIGTTANILIHNQELLFDGIVRNYIRYEVFQKDKRTPAENEMHVVTPYLRGQIERECPDVKGFISKIKALEPRVKPRRELNDKEIIISCGKKLTQQALLELVLHEMGHSFGLAHNFKASVDSENYYKTEDEIRAVFPKIDIEGLALSSSVMDYKPSAFLIMDYLGKYDLAALRYLYFDEIEMEDGSFADLKIETDPEKQQSILTKNTLQKRKKYLNCADWQIGKQIMCRKWDYGSNPKEIVQNYILTVKRFSNVFRYRYDLQESLFYNEQIPEKFRVQVNLQIRTFPFNQTFSQLLEYYKEWLKLRDNYLEVQNKDFVYILDDNKSIDDYTDTIEKGMKGDGEYELYYSVREEISDFLMELADLDVMKCHFTELGGQEHKFSLDLIKDRLSYKHGNDLYLEDCRSPQVLDFFETNRLALNGQAGYEDFVSYYPMRGNGLFKWDVWPISMFWMYVLQPGFFTGQLVKTPLHQLYELMLTAEPDKLKELSLKIQKQILDSEKNQTLFNTIYNEWLIELTIAGVNTMLENPKDESFLKQHIDNVNSMSYKIGTGSKSFDKEVMQSIRNLEGEELKEALSNLNSSFLETAHKEYVKFKSDRPTEYSDLSFQDYLLDREDTVNKLNQFLLVPLKKDSFLAQVFIKYNKTIGHLNKLRTKTELSDLENLYKMALEQHLDLLQQYIDNRVEVTQEQNKGGDFPSPSLVKRI